MSSPIVSPFLFLPLHPMLSASLSLLFPPLPLCACSWFAGSLASHGVRVGTPIPIDCRVYGRSGAPRPSTFVALLLAPRPPLDPGHAHGIRRQSLWASGHGQDGVGQGAGAGVRPSGECRAARTKGAANRHHLPGFPALESSRFLPPQSIATTREVSRQGRRHRHPRKKNQALGTTEAGCPGEFTDHIPCVKHPSKKRLHEARCNARKSPGLLRRGLGTDRCLSWLREAVSRDGRAHRVAPSDQL